MLLPPICDEVHNNAGNILIIIAPLPDERIANYTINHLNINSFQCFFPQ